MATALAARTSEMCRAGPASLTVPVSSIDAISMKGDGDGIGIKSRRPHCKHSTPAYDSDIRERSWHLPLKIALPVLAGQFLADWLWNKTVIDAFHHFPLRAMMTIAGVLMWSAYRAWRSARAKPFR